MFELLIFFLITTSITLFSGLVASSIFFRQKIDKLNIGEIGLIGIFFYTFLSFLVHFFFPLSVVVNLVLAVLLIISFFLFAKSSYKKIFEEKIFILISLIIIFFMTVKYKPNEDYGFYHLPYIINLISEKVIFGLSNLQPHFAWNSSWLNFSSLFNLPLMNLKGTQNPLRDSFQNLLCLNHRVKVLPLAEEI